MEGSEAGKVGANSGFLITRIARLTGDRTKQAEVARFPLPTNPGQVAQQK
jgi:hypothetical protein